MSNEHAARRGLLLVLSSPSGAGKTSLSRRLQEADPTIVMSVSATTRPPRPGEENGRDYHFLSVEAFERMRGEGAFLEHAQVHSNLYGTPRAPVEDALKAGRDVLFDIDWQGAQQLTQSAGADVVKVFILPPSIEALESRLRSRAQDSEEVIQRRLAKAKDEITHWAEYDYVIVNHELDTCFSELRQILDVERRRRLRLPRLADRVNALLAEFDRRE